ncbi:MAG TPA: flagellar basal-body rod protein FlgF [Bryobacteraceae bacterium]|jgi:flagellar basal-body rod protein FlgF
MDPLSISAASGMRARMESLDMLANNLANATTVGYKGDREFYSVYASSEALTDAGQVPEGADTAPVIQSPWLDLSQGVLRTTGNNLDMAIDGSGFFAVKGPRGNLYTRNGNFRLSADGTLVTADGYAVLTANGGTIQSKTQNPLDVAPDGQVTQQGQALGQLHLVNFPSRSDINKQGANYFYPVDPNTKPAVSSAQVYQGRLEDSNAGAAEGAIRLVGIMRQFEMLQRAAKLGAEMDRQSVEQVAKVSS